MTAQPYDVAAAQAQRRYARQQLMATVQTVKTRLSPGALAHDALDSAAEGAASAAEKGLNTVRARPLATASILGLATLIFARGFIGRKLAEYRTDHATRD